MERRMNLAYFINDTKPSLGIPGILREAIKTTIKNGKLMLCIVLIMFYYYSLLALANNLVLEPVLTDFISKTALLPKDVKVSEVDPSLQKAMLKVIGFFLIFKFIVLVFSCLMLMSSLAAATHSTYEAYTAKVISLNDMLLSIGSRWRRPLITTLCMILISFVSIVLYFIVIGVIALMTEGSLFHALLVTLFVLGACYYVYLSVLWMLSLMVSVLEENSSGLKAVERAHELMKGKRIQGCVLMLLLMFANGTIYVAFIVLAMSVYKAKLMSLAIRIVRIWLFCVMKLFLFVAYTLFYHECPRSRPMEEKPTLYVPISSFDI